MTRIHETPEQAARRLASGAIGDGFKPEALHAYTTKDGEPLYWRIRAKNPQTGDKWIRPMKHDGDGFALGEPAFANGKPLYKLHAVRANPNATVVVTEGESCADALAKIGVLATTSGSADSADKADWQPLQGRPVLIWPDHDDAGARYGASVKQKLAALGCSIRMIDVSKLGIPVKGDAIEWLATNRAATASAVLALPCTDDLQDSQLGAAEYHALVLSEPEPLRRPLPPAEPYPLEALGDVLGAAAKRICDVLCVPEAMAGQSVLAAASLAAQTHADIDIDGRRELLSLWHLTIGVSGERKSACDQVALRAHREHERLALEGYTNAKALHNIEMTAYEAATRSVSKSKDPEAIREEITRLGSAPEAPLKPLLLVGSPTIEGIHKQLVAGLPSIGLFHDDAGEFLGGHSMSQDHRTKTAAGLSKLWDLGEFDRVRAGDGAEKYWVFR